MNTHNFFMRRASERGVALVLVLGMLVLLSGLLVAFLTTATTERTSTQSASDGATARQIADTTVNLLIGQIRDATNSTKSDGSINERSTWASQPGAIRTFSGTQSSSSQSYPSGGGSYLGYTDGSEDYVFKLYSSDRLKVKSSDYMSKDLADEVQVIQKWDRSNPDPEHVDLNEPILSLRRDIEGGKTVEPRYPIIDPRARFDSSDIFKSNDPKSAVVEGFDAKISQDDNLKIPNKASTGAGDKLPYLPMPVKWLYVLRDGTVGSASEATDKNPIVGRTAFWTDDESCKLNINTSSEGTYWDTPTISSTQDSGTVDPSGLLTIPAPSGTSAYVLSLASAQPMKGEYQRYPGHPYTTCLSPVLGWLWGLTPMNPANPTSPATGSIYPSHVAYRQFKEAIYQISPFLPYGKPTTQGATQNSDAEGSGNASWYLKPPADPTGNTMAWDTGKPDPDIKTKHLYATVDELLFVPQRNSGRNPGDNNVTGTLNGKLTPQALEKTRFFLTATSRAPEINIFGRPRVTIWPVSKNPGNLRTANDDLFAFASTIYKDPNADPSRDNRFHLERQDAKDDWKDGIDPGNPSGSHLEQNKKMYEYLQKLTGGAGGLAIPSFGGSFSGKYGIDRDQILTEIFDYMRTVNMVDTGTASRAGNIFAPYTPRFFPLGIDPKLDQYKRYKRSVDWSGQVTPLKIGMVPDPNVPVTGVAPVTMGLGRFPVISEAALGFHRNTPIPATPGQQGLQCTLVLRWRRRCRGTQASVTLTLRASGHFA